MTNYTAVRQWAATVKVDEALKEMSGLKAKYPWLKCEKTMAVLEKLDGELGMMMQVILHQEKQNAILRQVIETNKYADETIVEAIKTKFNL